MGVVIGIILGVVAEGRDIKKLVAGHAKIIIIGVIVVSVVVFLTFSEYSYVLIIIYIVVYLLSPLSSIYWINGNNNIRMDTDE